MNDRLSLSAGEAVESFERLSATAEQMAVVINQVLGMHEGITLRRDQPDGTWSCESPPPHEVWFGETLLKFNRRIGPWEIRPGYVRLTTADGEWIWRLTGETTVVSDQLLVDLPLTLHRGVWPD